MKHLKHAAVRGGAANLIAQIVCAALRIGSTAILARILTPGDFGLVAMITSVIGMLNLFKDFGLSTATVQRTSVIDAELSNLFWINIFIGGVLALAVLASARPLAVFYNEPRLFLVAAALSSNFLINSLGIQHLALLQRQMRFTLIASIEALSLLAGIVVAVILAMLDFGYWALVAMTLTNISAHTTAVCISSGWKPGLPRRDTDIRSMLKIGGGVTLNAIVMYFAYNLEKVLIGKFLGAPVLGLYSRAQQLISFPTDNLNTAAGSVMVSALCRVKEEPHLWKRYFLKGYSLLLSFTIPITVFFALYAEDLISILLGPKWMEATPILRALSPTVLVLGIINPLWSLLVSLGLIARSLKMALVLAPLIILGYSTGLQWGILGVASGFSIVMTVWAIPHLAWTIHGTPVHLMDIARAIGKPLAATLLAGTCTMFMTSFLPDSTLPILRLAIAATAFGILYSWVLLRAMHQWPLYADIWATLRPQTNH